MDLVVKKVLLFLEVLGIKEQDVVFITRDGSWIFFDNFRDYDCNVVVKNSVVINHSDSSLMLSDGKSLDLCIYSLGAWGNMAKIGDYWSVLKKYAKVIYGSEDGVDISDVTKDEKVARESLVSYDKGLFSDHLMDVKRLWLCICLMRTLERGEYRLTKQDLKEMQLAHDKKLNIENYRQEFYIIYNEYNAC